MKKTLLLLPVILLALVFSLALTSCDEPPEEEIITAEDAIKKALEYGADEASPRLLEKAQKLMQEAKMLNEQGKFKEARQKAEFAKIRADKAVMNAERLEEASKRND